MIRICTVNEIININFHYIIYIIYIVSQDPYIEFIEPKELTILPENKCLPFHLLCSFSHRIPQPKVRHTAMLETAFMNLCVCVSTKNPWSCAGERGSWTKTLLLSQYFARQVIILLVLCIHTG